MRPVGRSRPGRVGVLVALMVGAVARWRAPLMRFTVLLVVVLLPTVTLMTPADAAIDRTTNQVATPNNARSSTSVALKGRGLSRSVTRTTTTEAANALASKGSTEMPGGMIGSHPGMP